MGFTRLFSLQATLRSNTPPSVIAWLENSIAGTPSEPDFAIDEPLSGWIEQVAWLLGRPGASRLSVLGPSSGWALAIQARLHDEEFGAVFGTPLLVAPHCPDGIIALEWTDMSGTWPTLFLVQDGVAFMCEWNGVPQAMPSAVPDAARVWRLGYDQPDGNELERYGAPRAEILAAEAERSGDAVLARYLLLRSVLRAAESVTTPIETGPEERPSTQGTAGLGRQIASDAVRATLEILDRGADPLALNDTPGWSLQEVGRFERTSGTRRTSGRSLRGLVEGLDQFRGAEHSAGPRPFRTGQTVRVLSPVRLVARGPFIHSQELHQHRPGGMAHHLDLEVPPGTALELTKVYEKGHAECLPVGGDWTAWVVDRPGSAGVPNHPVGRQEDYAIGWLSPQDEGTIFAVDDP